ncbi:putative Late nodulin [Medicago truncatula]|uniref:Nodule Cysteine-Rich (NCR) secreted peptide n=1 Tax=Medicago truncatula TaxID=3880 RepID=A0A072TFS3_MEDTR|nr:Nodule Cysteine-Rich (NCR) secreted peptide [Medicago truncatula]RHN51996.1 putative Late nodulin [Medicago truncatula]RHN51998.1 putative Late nodulin [Medicago truncatula]
MAQFLLFIYSLIIFLSLFFGEAAYERTEPIMHNGEPINLIPCVTVADCPRMDEPLHMTCLVGACWPCIRSLY